jgi:hypothetical protein
MVTLSSSEILGDKENKEPFCRYKVRTCSYPSSVYNFNECIRLTGKVVGAYEFAPLIIQLEMATLQFSSVNFFNYQMMPRKVVVRPDKRLIYDKGTKLELKEAYGMNI